MKSTPTDELEAELSTTPTDLHLEQLQRHKAIKMYQDPNSYFSHMIRNDIYSNTKPSPCKYLQNIFKQLLTELAIQKNCSDIDSRRLPAINPPTFEIFSIPNLEIILPNILEPKISMDSDINYIKEINNKNTMLIFTQMGQL